MILLDNLLSKFETIKNLRRSNEIRWLEDLRQSKAEYDASVMAKIIQMDGSRVYPNFTRSKVRPTISKINAVFFPHNNKAWKIDIEDSQQLPQWTMDTISEQYSKSQEQSVTVVKKLISNLKKKYLNKVERILTTQLDEMNFEDWFKYVNQSAVTYGTGILKGINTKSVVKYQSIVENGQIMQIPLKEYKPYAEYVSIWNIFPDMSTSLQTKMSYVFQTHRVSKKELMEYASYPGFEESKITDYIKRNSDGDYEVPYWEQEMISLSDNTQKAVLKTADYQLLEYWGYISGKDLGKEDETGSYMATVWILGKQIIKKEEFPIDSANSLYHFFYYEKDESSIFGVGLPRLIRGTQLTIAASARMIIDNATSVIAPQIELNTDLLTPGQVTNKIHPRKIWYREGRGQEAQYPAIRVYNFDSHITEYMSIIELFKRFGDEESNLSSFAWGDTSQIPANSTASGINQISSNINLAISDVVKLYERESKKVLKNLILWNKEYNKKEEKAFSFDFDVTGFGYEAAMDKGAKLQSMITIGQTLTSEDNVYINKRELLRRELELMDISTKGLLRSDEEVAQIQQTNAQSPQTDLLNAGQAADIQYTKAKATNMLAKAKQTLDSNQKNQAIDLLKSKGVSNAE